MEWLARHLENDQRTHCGLVGAAIGTLARFGRRDDSQRLAEWLLGRQRNDGSFSDSPGPKHSLFATACAIGGLLALDVPRQPAMKNDFGGAALRAAEFLMRQADDYGPTMSGHGSVGSLEHHFPEIAALACVPALAEAADWSHRSDFAAAAQRILHRLRPSLVPDFWSRALPQVTLAAEAALAVGRCDLAMEVLRPLVATQRRSGDVPAWPGARWVSTAGLAHLTALWYRLGEHERADRSLAWLARRQNRSGSFYGSVGTGGCAARREDPWTALWYLEATRLQVDAAFQRSPIPRELDARDGRVRELAAWLSCLAPAAMVADVGCGVGRYLVPLTELFPKLRFTAIDSCQPLLAFVPPAVPRRHGSILRLPASDGEFDAAYAVEVLEHALVPGQAIAELCRVVRPGGLVMVIDKNRSFQALSHHESWERWFTRHEVVSWLERDCQEVRCREIAHGALARPSGLFFCWVGVRRAESSALHQVA